MEARGTMPSQTAAAAAGLLTGVAACCTTATLLGLAADSLAPWIAWCALATGLAAGAAAARHHQPPAQPRHPTSESRFWQGFVAAAFCLYAARSFFWLLYIDKDALVVSSAYNHGDLSLHVGLIRHMASGAAFWPENTLMPHADMNYPLGSDLLNALLLLAGVPLATGLVWTGLVGSLATLRTLWMWGGTFAVAAFLFAGGLSGFAILCTGEWADYQSDMDWKSPALALFVPQRGLLHAIPAGLLLLASWRHRGQSGAGILPFWAELLLYATMPLFHLHTFLFLSTSLLFLFLIRRGAPARHFLLLATAALLPASLLVLRVTNPAQGAAALGWQPGWLREDTPLLAYWIQNFGIFLLFLPLLPACLLLKKNSAPQTYGGLSGPPPPSIPSTDFALALAASTLFLAACLFRFAPWAWDNTKLMFWCWLVILPLAWQYLISPLARLFRYPVVLLLFGSGFVSLWGGLAPLPSPNVIAKRSELAAVNRMLQSVPADARLAIAPAWNHPVLLLGAKAAIGYDGHLWSHGYNYSKEAIALEQLMSGLDDGTQTSRILDANYVFWGPREQKKYHNNPKAWFPFATPVAEDPEFGFIYHLMSAPQKIAKPPPNPIQQ